MDYMFKIGFLGTNAPFFMDVVTIIVALLPLLLLIGISLAKNGKYKSHKVAQIFIFIVSAIVIGYFEYGVRIGGGFEKFAKNSSLPYDFLFYFLIFHVFIAITTLFLWIRAIRFAFDSNYHFRVSSFYDTRHAKMGKYLLKWIILTGVTGIMVYVFLFMF
ncbi:MAG: DUF420 domain-containing protein [Sulfurovaceae bacterium]|nr:DUF420 domain-containing protein [Sulfurovaceae bacterium]MDD5549583.1 DUF420 domain-containing protein [Sulfurovaceae bacterium]